MRGRFSLPHTVPPGLSYTSHELENPDELLDLPAGKAPSVQVSRGPSLKDGLLEICQEHPDYHAMW